MENRDVDSYRGSCLVLSKNRYAGRGHFESNRNFGQPWVRRSFSAPMNRMEIHRPPMSMVCERGMNFNGPMYPVIRHRRGSCTPPRKPMLPKPCPQYFRRSTPYGGPRSELETLNLQKLSVSGPEKPSTASTLPKAVPVQAEERSVSLSPPSSSDTVSVTSDEGSVGSTADTSLPRIIKPRKRRKKDRKPSPPATPDVKPPKQDETDANSPTSATCEGTKPPSKGCTMSCSVSFPTPPPSPAGSLRTSPPLVPSSSGSDDEACVVWHPPICDRGALVRCHSAPQSMPSNQGVPPRLTMNPSIPPVFYNNRNPAFRMFNQEVSLEKWPNFRHRHCSGPPGMECTWQGHPVFSQRRNISDTVPVPSEREWQVVGHATASRPSCRFTVMCYNVLCDKYATRQMYGYCPPWALDWTYRKDGIMSEINRYSADIITLQEVETDQFYKFFLPKLRVEGYNGIFSPKSRAKTMNETERKYVDGCAIFWKNRKFTLAKEHLIEFNQLAMANHDGNQDMLNRVMTKDNIGLAALLHTTETAWTDTTQVMPDKNQIRQPILVCTAHIHWDPEFCDVKLIQTIMLMSEIRSILNNIVEDSPRTRHQRKDIHDIHLLLCGDLNSLPESGVVEFMTKGSVSMDHEDFKGHGYKASLQKMNNALSSTANMYSHGFRLASAYDNTIMPYTNYTYDFKGIIDYIFHSANSLNTLGVLGPISPEWFANHQIVGCPHPHVPSDHFPLLAELELAPINSAHSNGLSTGR